MMSARTLAATFTLALATGLASPALSTPAAAAQTALLIGIGAYENISQLSGPVNDVRRMKDFLIAHLGFRENEITTITDGQATYRGLQQTMQQVLVDGTSPGDRVLVYYSGHGGQVPDHDGDEDDQLDETLVSVDAYADRDEGHNQFTDDEFGALLGQIEDRIVTVIIDACHSGTITRGMSAPRTMAQAVPRTPIRFAGTVTRGAVEAHRAEESYIRSTPNRHVWSAAAAFQYSWESGGLGLFTTYFIEGAGERLADANNNGMVSNAELIDYARGKAEAWCSQTPVCANLNLGFTPVLEAPSDAMANAIVPVGQTSEDPTDVIVQSNDAGVTIDVLPSSSVNLGENIWFRVSSQRPGWLVLLDINADGEVTQLIPNDIMTEEGINHRIEPGQHVTIPEIPSPLQFTASEPVGEGTLMAIVTEDNVDLGQLVEASRNLRPTNDAGTYLTQLAQSLLDIWQGGDNNRELNWSLATLKYRISR